MKNALKIILASALVTAGALTAAPALAEPAATPPADVAQRVVHTGDLDLTSRSGQRQLRLRLSHAAREVCGSASDADLAGKNAVRACRDQALASALVEGRRLAASSRPAMTIAVTAAR